MWMDGGGSLGREAGEDGLVGGGVGGLDDEGHRGLGREREKERVVVVGVGCSFL